MRQEITPHRWEKIERLFHAASERMGEDRASYLKNACDGDEELRKEVESLLSHGKTAEGWLGGDALKEVAKEVFSEPNGRSLEGEKLGPYQVLSSIGAGGMGEVYKARDTRLNRMVAIKVLPDQFANRSELRERFEREARTIASLNHPHICTLYDVGHQDGTDYLVLEYLEGETLAERLKKGPLPLEQVLQYAIEITDALDKAHRKGITHRDLKPGNIMLTKSGAKLLDFGLAKFQHEANAAEALSQRPTGLDSITGKGAIVGTLQYMAPEQIEGKPVDARTDIFAFGAVVYEMATGKRAFDGQSQASLIAKTLEVDPPPMTSIQSTTPPALDHLVKRCLAKDPGERWQSAKDICEQLRWLSESREEKHDPAIAAVVAQQRRAKKRLVWAGVVVAALVATRLAFFVYSRVTLPSPGVRVVRFAVALPPAQQLSVLSGSEPHAIALSPDGTQLAYVARQNGVTQIFLRALNSLESKPLPGTEEGSTPFFSPDSQWLGFVGGYGKLKKVSIDGGPAVDLCDVDSRLVFGASWGSQGSIVFGYVGGLRQVPESGGSPKQLTTVPGTSSGTSDHMWPEFLPGGKAVLFVRGVAADPRISVVSIETGGQRDLIAGKDPVYSPTGHLLYSQGGTLMAAPFDLQRLAVTGTGVPVAEGILQRTPDVFQPPAADYSISATGSLAFVPGVATAAPLKLTWVSRSGAEQPLPAPAHIYLHPRLSPDGQRIAVGITEKESQVWLYDIAQGTLSRFTFEGSNNLTPFWTRDGQRIVFISNKEGPRNIFSKLADGSGGLERLTTSENLDIPGSFSPDGQVLAFAEIDPHTGYDIWTLRLKGSSAETEQSRKPQPFLKTSFNENVPQFSPDGHWLAYVSDESGRYEIYVVPYPGPGGKWQISTEGGREPLWNRNGRELFYRSGNKMMAVDINTRMGFSAGTPKMLFEGPYQSLSTSTPNYDVSADGQRFLMLKSTEQPAQINVVLNWFEELKQKVPSGTR
jgi:serine/threonine protein kinase